MRNIGIYAKRNQEAQGGLTDTISLLGIISAILVAILPMSTVSIGGNGLMLYIGAAMLAVYIVRLAKNQFRLRFDKLTKALLLVVLYALCACFFNSSITFNFIIEYTKNILIVFILINSVFSNKDTLLIEVGAIISCIVTCYNILNAPTISFLDDRSTVVIFGVAQDPNHICFLYIIPIYILMNIITENKSKILKIIAWTLIVLVFYSILLTGSRGGLLSCIIEVFLFVCLKYRGSGKLVVVGLLLILVIYILSPYLLNLLPESVARRFSVEQVIRDNGSGRTDIWKNAFNAICNNPILTIFGHGTGSSRSIIGSATHNTAIQVLLENGIIGIILWINLLIQLAKRLLEKNNFYKLAMLAGTLLMAMDVSANTLEYYWFALAVCTLL